ncbi:MAG TPA: GNAT family N-acetyltransferase [Microbacterium sp.]|uniref:GNAT family N-acetyltransferase n=1 Tax=Microbacterium sp. TaxID=51671 RepID=UPI002BE7C2EB|nr:GNAT family N-acetyltransferase [Microbacterium sp.]HWI31398.1 GNAT family N-acetyltransferase [Microbacterium sp.]
MTDQATTPEQTAAPTADDAQKTVTRDEAAGRYEIRVDGALAGFTEIEPDGHGRVIFPHTEIDPAFKGMGLSKILVREALSDAARRGETIVPLCAVVRKYLREHDVPGAVIDWPHRGDAQDAATPGETPA